MHSIQVIMSRIFQRPTQNIHHQGGDVIANFKLLYYFSRVSGLNGFHLPNNPNKTVHLSSFVIMHSVITMIVYSTIGFMNSNENFRFNFSRSIYMNIGFRFTLASSSVYTITVIIADLYNRKKIWSIVTECACFDNQVRKRR